MILSHVPSLYIEVTEEQAAILLKEHWLKSNSYLKVA
jgi:hypothetical protein